METKSQSEISGAVESAKNKWANSKRYWPEYRKQDIDIFEWFHSWADKASMTSMFCFKLVYNTFLQINVDLDSDRTTFSSAAAFWGPNSYFDSGTRAFIGVTGDDIYFSDQLGSSIFAYGVSYLGHPVTK